MLSYVDRSGRIHLFRFARLGGSYLGELGHETVYACRMEWRSRRQRARGYGYRFVDESFAEYIATRAGLYSTAFLYYGSPVHLVAGQ
jgi:hypothetical protein